jgi:UDP-N-acetylglucosamine/UDP-N-acetylgalactosamine diphosphorylase
VKVAYEAARASLGEAVIRVENEADQVLIAKVHKAGQSQVLRYWSGLDGQARRRLLAQLREVDFQELSQLTRKLVDVGAESPASGPLTRSDVLVPVEAIERAREAERATMAKLGERLLEAGKVAAFVVAGGQGTRLGWEAPKGTYPVTPASSKSLFQIFAEQILARGRRHGVEIPWVVMTSSANDVETRRFFTEHENFGLSEGQIHFVAQRDMVSVDARGRLMLANPGRLATSPNGHGGSVEALARGGLLEELRGRGLEHLFYFQVDNPLCPVLDPVFLGYHAQAEADASTKVISKVDPWEKVGVLGLRAGELCVIEYSELSEDLRQARDAGGRLCFRAGNIANHMFRLDFLAERAAAGAAALPYHMAHKAVAHLDAGGSLVEPSAPNAFKFERFIFDLLGEARNHVTLEVDASEEFEPLKNARGKNSAETVRDALIARDAAWCEACGLEVARDEAGRPRRLFEISPLTALSAEELGRHLDGVTEVPGGSADFVI